MNMSAGFVRIAMLGLVAAAPNATADEVILGQTLDLSGPAGNIGQALKRGRESCLSLVNQRAQAGGMTYRLLTLDDRGNPATALSNAQRLVDSDHAIGLLGPMGAAAGAAVLPWAAHARVSVVDPYGGDVESRVKEWDTTFFLTANQSAEAQRIASHVRSLGTTRIAVLYSSDTAGRAALTAFEEALGVVEIPPMKLVPIESTQQAANAAVEVIRGVGADAVILATTGEATVRALKAFHAAGRSGAPLQIYALSSAASLADLKVLGDAAEGLSMSEVLPSPREVRLPVIAAFRQAISARDSDASYVELEGCLSVLVTTYVMRRKGAHATRNGLLNALQSAGIVDVGGLQIDLDDRSGANRFTDIVYIASGGRAVR